jgi:hypothetical protein
MAYAITLRLDPPAGVVVQAMWRALANQGIGRSVIHPTSPSLSTRKRPLPPKFASALALQRGNGAHCQSTCRDTGIPGPPAVVWIAPVITADLLARHASLHRALRTFPCERHYLPGNWMPHITLTSAATSASRAMEVLTPLWKGAMLANLDRLELVSFHPFQVLWTQALGFL